MNFVNEKFHTLRFEVPTQTFDSRFSRDSMDSASKINSFTLNVIMIVIVIQQTMGGSALRYFMWYLRTF